MTSHASWSRWSQRTILASMPHIPPIRRRRTCLAGVAGGAAFVIGGLVECFEPHPQVANGTAAVTVGSVALGWGLLGAWRQRRHRIE